ncbi:sugar transferase [Enterococcus phoeniculicola]|uniref:Bacterial sugar transferase domain-containing protein n=1 Tax=Enterococcus phoeniculicola ATCC BAA-412 TaxID=1158610 RepID=R3W5S4_9ENTE|nr:sugar transferase [Enterococcus phoeniculicola]EOL42986.1 hypothetical protein UC3_01963 [Enterococcus phoeniculicola ATCC BAA-412]EOT76656.1 hypothetical protein I589_01613 [Enterococcus phoeniculicola ATCC BAA-412]
MKNNTKISFHITKRGIDIIGACLGILLLMPLLLLIAFLVKLEYPEENFYFIQERVGKNGEVFYLYKFRSMVPQAETMLEALNGENEILGAMFKIKNDPRITNIGKFIRKTSLDELPQLFNVLKGNMSLVGPRPPLTQEVQKYTLYDRQRLSVTPGCTGLWQVSGRNKLDFYEMVELDLRYIATQSIKNDTIILFKTIKVLFLMEGAY